jgi:uncharacterized protein (TIGR02996 family)
MTADGRNFPALLAAYPEAAAFWAAVRNRPDDDTPRLVFADWLDDHAGTMACPGCKGKGRRTARTPPVTCEVDCWDCGGSGRVSNGNAERAELIRVGIAVNVKAGSQYGVMGCREEAEREAELARVVYADLLAAGWDLDTLWTRWPSPTPYPDPGRDGPITVEVRRGLPHRLAGDFNAIWRWPTAADDNRAAVPDLLWRVRHWPVVGVELHDRCPRRRSPLSRTRVGLTNPVYCWEFPLSLATLGDEDWALPRVWRPFMPAPDWVPTAGVDVGYEKLDLAVRAQEVAAAAWLKSLYHPAVAAGSIS